MFLIYWWSSQLQQDHRWTWTSICVTISIFCAVVSSASVWSIDGQNALFGCCCGCGRRTPASRRPVGDRALSGQLASGTGLRHPTMVVMVAWDQKPGDVRRLCPGIPLRLLVCLPPLLPRRRGRGAGYQQVCSWTVDQRRHRRRYQYSAVAATATATADGRGLGGDASSRRGAGVGRHGAGAGRRGAGASSRRGDDATSARAGADAEVHVQHDGWVGRGDVLGVPVGAGRRREGEGADGVHALLPRQVRREVAARERHLPALPRPRHCHRGQRSTSPAAEGGPKPQLSLARNNQVALGANFVSREDGTDPVCTLFKIIPARATEVLVIRQSI